MLAGTLPVKAALNNDLDASFDAIHVKDNSAGVSMAGSGRNDLLDAPSSGQIDGSDGLNAVSASYGLMRQLGPSSRRSPLIISEIMYHPSDLSGSNDLEFVELFNTEPVDWDISGFRLEGETDYTFPDGTIFPGRSFIVVAGDPATAESEYGISGVYGPLDGNLNNAGGVLRLVNMRGGVLLEIEYNDRYPWPEEADGLGHSLVMTRPDYGENDPRAWEASTARGGNPGTTNSLDLAGADGVCINEVLAEHPGGQAAFIELYNNSTTPANISGYYLSDNPDQLKFRIPDSTTILPGGYKAFSTNDWGSAMYLTPNGERVYLLSADEQRVIDAARYGTEEPGISLGHYPNGRYGFRALASPTPGSKNTALLRRDIVINEIMYHPISEDSRDEYLELYNHGTGTVDVSGWQLTDGVIYTIPDGTVIPADGYLVIAADAERLIGTYSNLTTANTLGNYDGRLNNGGERVRLSKPLHATPTNEEFIVVDEVTYGDGSAWGKWTDAGGSSLELIDPLSDNSRPDNWAGSDETGKAPWTTFSHTGAMDNGAGDCDETELMLLDNGECMVDDISITKSGETANRVSNGDFESGNSGWTIEGNHSQSATESNNGYGNSIGMHMIATGDGDNMPNCLRSGLTANLDAGDTATIEARARWLCGNRNVLIRLHGNYLEAVGELEIPAELGTPGAQNSVYSANAGPVIENTTHAPVLPEASENITVSALVHDPDGLGSVTLYYRIDPGTTFTSAIMNDSGMLGDILPGDHIYTATIPGQADDTIVAFYIQAEDNAAAPATARYPASAPDRECLVMVGDALPAGVFGTYKMWVCNKNKTYWSSVPKMSNEMIDGTFVYGDVRAVYGASIRMRGSGWIRSRTGDPFVAIASYAVKVPKSDRITGSTSLTLDNLQQEDVWGRGVLDPTFLRERMSFWTGERIGVETCYQRFVQLYLNSTKKGVVYTDTHHPNRDYRRCWFPYDDNGHIFEADSWFEYENDFPSYKANATLEDYTTTGGVKKQARYRWCWEKKVAHATDDDYDPLFELVDTMNNGGGYYEDVDALVDWNQWMRGIAVRRGSAVDRDGYGYQAGKNAYIYKGHNMKWKYILWDLDLGMGIERPYDAGLFSEIGDPVLATYFFQEPAFRRAYWRALKDLVDGPMAPGEFNPVIDAYYAAFQASGISTDDPAPVKTWVGQRRDYIISQMSTVDADFEITSNNGNDFSTANSPYTFQGTAPVNVDAIKVNGAEYPVTWTDVTSWSIAVGLVPGANYLEFTGYDSYGNEIAGMTDSITVTYTGPAVEQPQPVINEIMYHPAVVDAEFVELYNPSSVYPVNLTGYRLNGIDCTFASNTWLQPNEYAVVVENIDAFKSTYGPDITILAEFDGRLDNGGETLTLFAWDPATQTNIAVDTVKYDDTAPWPLAADGTGPSLQLIDPTKDNRRVANWAVSDIPQYTPGVENSVHASLPGFPDIWINELQTENVSGITDNAGDNDPWTELVCFGGGAATTEEITFIPSGATWKYLDNGSDQGTAWREVTFNDSGWASGPAELGYGDGDEVTTVSYGTSAQNKYITTYFRHTFIIPDADAVESLSLDLLRDDGAVVYLNGTEIRRDNMTGDVYYTLLATPAVAGTDESTFYNSSENPAGLRTGTNVLAVEIHQHAVDSSDISFNLRLKGMVSYSFETLDGYYLSDDLVQPAKWAFPSSTPISNGLYMVVWADGEPGETTADELHTSFMLANATGVVVFARVQGNATQVLDYVQYAPLAADTSYGSLPDGTSYRMVFSVPTPGAPNNAAERSIPVFINEWMASNTKTVQDPADGNYDDWFELYNAGTQQVDISGCVLSDGGNDWTIPQDTIIQSDDFLLVWADRQMEQNGFNGDLHADFKLSRNGEEISISFEGIVIDRVVFGAQEDDISVGRWPDGYTNIFRLSPATPGQPNEIPEPGIFAGIVLAGFLCSLKRRP
jgi:hypothetical protein